MKSILSNTDISKYPEDRNQYFKRYFDRFQSKVFVLYFIYLPTYSVVTFLGYDNIGEDSLYLLTATRFGKIIDLKLSFVRS